MTQSELAKEYTLGKNPTYSKRIRTQNEYGHKYYEKIILIK